MITDVPTLFLCFACASFFRTLTYSCSPAEQTYQQGTNLFMLEKSKTVVESGLWLVVGSKYEWWALPQTNCPPHYSYNPVLSLLFFFLIFCALKNKAFIFLMPREYHNEQNKTHTKHKNKILLLCAILLRTRHNRVQVKILNDLLKWPVFSKAD